MRHETLDYDWAHPAVHRLWPHILGDSVLGWRSVMRWNVTIYDPHGGVSAIAFFDSEDEARRYHIQLIDRGILRAFLRKGV